MLFLLHLYAVFDFVDVHMNGVFLEFALVKGEGARCFVSEVSLFLKNRIGMPGYRTKTCD